MTGGSSGKRIFEGFLCLNSGSNGNVIVTSDLPCILARKNAVSRHCVLTRNKIHSHDVIEPFLALKDIS